MPPADMKLQAQRVTKLHETAELGLMPGKERVEGISREPRVQSGAERRGPLLMQHSVDRFEDA